MRNERVNIIEKYEEFEVLISPIRPINIKTKLREI